MPVVETASSDRNEIAPMVRQNASRRTRQLYQRRLNDSETFRAATTKCATQTSCAGMNVYITPASNTAQTAVLHIRARRLVSGRVTKPCNQFEPVL